MTVEQQYFVRIGLCWYHRAAWRGRLFTWLCAHRPQSNGWSDRRQLFRPSAKRAGTNLAL